MRRSRNDGGPRRLRVQRSFATTLTLVIAAGSTLSLPDGAAAASNAAATGSDLRSQAVEVSDVGIPAAQSTAQLTTDDLVNVLPRAAATWPAAERAELGEVRLAIVDLPGDALAVTTAAGIAIDVDAAGHGWFVDATSSGDAAFQIGPDGRWRARAGSAAEGRMDLTTVLAHEIGHLLGRAELEFRPLAGVRPLMASHLDPGERRFEVGFDAGHDPAVPLALAAGAGFNIRAATAPTEPEGPAPEPPATTQPPTTQPPTTQPPSTEPPAATEPATTEPATTEPATTEPATTEPATTEPATTEPAATEPAATEPAATEPATTEPAGAETGDDATAGDDGAAAPESGDDGSGTAEPGATTTGDTTTGDESGSDEPESSEPESPEPESSEPESSEPGAAEPTTPEIWQIVLDGVDTAVLSFGTDRDGNGTASFRDVVRRLSELAAIAITGSDADDVLEIRVEGHTFPEAFAVTFDGRGGADTLIGPGIDASWLISALNQGVMTADGLTVEFSDVETLEGAAGNEDTFVVAPGATVSGAVHGGDGGYDSVIAIGDYHTVDYAIGERYGDGVLIRDGVALTFTGMEPIDITGTVAEIIFRPWRPGTGAPGGTAGEPFEGITDDVINVEAFSGPNGLVNRIHGTSRAAGSGDTPEPFEELRFVNPTERLIIEGHGGTDIVNVISLDPNFRADLLIFGQDRASQNRPCDPSVLETDEDDEDDKPEFRCTEVANTTVNFLGNLLLNGGSIEVVARHVVVAEGVRLCTLANCGGGAAPGSADGSITFWVRQFRVEELAKIDKAIWVDEVKEVSISIGTDATLEAGTITFRAYAEDRAFGDLTGEGEAEQVEQLSEKYDHPELNLPYKIVQRTAIATVTIGERATLRSTGDIGISISATADATGKAMSEEYSFGLALATAEATIEILQHALIEAAGSVNINAAASTIARMTTQSNHYKPAEDGEEEPERSEVNVSVAVAIADLTARAELAENARIVAGKAVNFRATGSKQTEASAEAGMYIDGTAGLAAAIQYSEALVRTVIAGEIEARMVIGTDPRTGFLVLEFDPTAAKDELGYVDGETNKIYVGTGHGLATGDTVTYSSRRGIPVGGVLDKLDERPLPGLVDGTTYYVIDAGDGWIQLAATELDAFRGTAVPLVCAKPGEGDDDNPDAPGCELPFNIPSGVCNYDFITNLPLPDVCPQAALNIKTFDAGDVNRPGAEPNTIRLGNLFEPVENVYNYAVLGNALGLGQAVRFRANGGSIAGLVDGAIYYVITGTGALNPQGDSRFTHEQVIQLARTANEALAGVAITLGAANGTGFQLEALHVLDSGLVDGIGVISSLQSKDSVSAQAGLSAPSDRPEDPPEGEDDIPQDDPQYLTNLKNATAGLPEPLRNWLYETLKGYAFDPPLDDFEIPSLPAIPNWGISGAFAINIVKHTVETILRPTAELRSNGDIEARAEIEQQLSQRAISIVEMPETPEGEDPPADPPTPNENAVSIALAVGDLTNRAAVTVEGGAQLDALRAVRLNSAITYPFVTRPDEYFPMNLHELNEALKQDPDALKKYGSPTRSVGE